jgi:hypothetical protein
MRLAIHARNVPRNPDETMPHAQVPQLVDLRIRGHLEVLLEEAHPWNLVSGTQYRYGR